MNKESLKLKVFLTVLLPCLGLLTVTSNANAEYWLVIGSYRQGPGSKPHVSGITSPSLFAVPTKTLEQCQNAGEKINNEIYRPVWQFDNRWTCIYTGT
tara:strand:- start:440 stop:733 length:294 start_codon:yes stop_codon:yes gene_type:complete